MKKLLAGAVCAVLLVACGKKSEAPVPAPAPAPTVAPRAPVSGIDRVHFDPQVRPQDDLFRAVNGTWLREAEIPADRSNYGAFSKLDDDAELQLKAIIEQAAAQKNRPAGSDAQKVGDLYASFLDQQRAQQLGLKPLEGELARIDGLKSKADIPALLARFSQLSVSSPVFFYIGQDEKIATQYIVHLAQAAPYSGDRSGLGLPDRDYYLSDEAKFKTIRDKYVEHVGKTLALAGVKDTAAGADILKLETRIARLHWTRVEDRDDDKTYNKYELAQMQKLAPGFDWNAYVAALGVEKTPGLIVRQPGYFTSLDKLLAEVPLAQWQTYFKWHLLKSYADYLPTEFVDADFGFYGQTLAGIQEIRPRWKRGVSLVEASLGEVLGRIYVERHFPPQAKQRMEKLVDNLKLAYQDSIANLEWMSPETKTRAQEKLAKFTTKIGYPNKWKDYSKLEIKADDLVGNVMRSSEVEFAREAAKLGGPIDRDEWGMTPQTVNAYYNPGLNEIVFPAAILQPPFFNMEADDAVNYGGIGAVIGHEIGHGFDDQGSKYDGDGNLKSWWTDEDRKQFEARTKMLIAQYDAFCPLEGQCVSGALTIGENIGDLGGLSIAYKAYRASLGGKEGPVLDGFTGDQRFFMGWAQAWRRKYREEELLRRLKTDPHSPSEYRCNGIVANLPQFYQAFGVKETDKHFLAPEKRVSIW